MKSSTELGWIVAAAVLAGFVTWMIDGCPSGNPAEQAAEVPLREGEVRLKQVLEADGAGLLWVDARPAETWRKDGLDGSINLTALSDEPLGAQIERHLDAIATAERIIVYCDDVNCDLSHELVARIRGDYGDLIPAEMQVLHGGAAELREAGMLKGSTRSP